MLNTPDPSGKGIVTKGESIDILVNRYLITCYRLVILLLKRELILSISN